MSAALINMHTPETPWSFHDQPIIVGKDILEVLSNAMYVDPLAIYREYIQNAADAIDEARRTSVFSTKKTGTVEIEIDIEKRTVIIRDNGTGISAADFESRLTSFGASVSVVQIRVAFEASADYQDSPTAKSFCSVQDQPGSLSFRNYVGTVERLRLYFVPQISPGTSVTWSPS